MTTKTKCPACFATAPCPSQVCEHPNRKPLASASSEARCYRCKADGALEIVPGVGARCEDHEACQKRCIGGIERARRTNEAKPAATNPTGHQRLIDQAIHTVRAWEEDPSSTLTENAINELLLRARSAVDAPSAIVDDLKAENAELREALDRRTQEATPVVEQIAAWLEAETTNTTVLESMLTEHGTHYRHNGLPAGLAELAHGVRRRFGAASRTDNASGGPAKDLDTSSSFGNKESELRDRSKMSRESLIAEIEMLRGVGCSEDGDGPCGACLKCALAGQHASQLRQNRS